MKAKGTSKISSKTAAAPLLLPRAFLVLPSLTALLLSATSLCAQATEKSPPGKHTAAHQNSNDNSKEIQPLRKEARAKRDKIREEEEKAARENLVRLASLNEQIARQPTAQKYSQRAEALIKLSWNGELNTVWRRTEYTNVKALNAALLDLDQALKLAPKTAHYYEQKGEAYALKGLQRNAVEQFTSAIALDGKNKILYLKRAFSLYECAEHKLAIADLNAYIDQDKTTAIAYLVRARMYFQEGEKDKAIADMNKAIEIKPGVDDLYEERGILYHSLKRDDLAAADFKRQLASCPKGWSAHKNLAEVYIAQKNWTEARKELDILISRKPRNARYRFMRATVFEHLGNAKLATEDENYGKTLAGNGQDE